MIIQPFEICSVPQFQHQREKFKYFLKFYFFQFILKFAASEVQYSIIYLKIPITSHLSAFKHVGTLRASDTQSFAGVQIRNSFIVSFNTLDRYSRGISVQATVFWEAWITSWSALFMRSEPPSSPPPPSYLAFTPSPPPPPL